MYRAGTAQPVAVALEGVEHAVVIEHLFHRDLGAYGPEVHEGFLGFVHAVLLSMF